MVSAEFGTFKVSPKARCSGSGAVVMQILHVILSGPLARDEYEYYLLVYILVWLLSTNQIHR